MDQIGFLNFHGGTTRFSYLIGIEKGRTVYRDIGGSDPERMAPPRVEEYITQLFANTPVTVKVFPFVTLKALRMFHLVQGFLRFQSPASFHVYSLAHLIQSRAFSSCIFS